MAPCGLGGLRWIRLDLRLASACFICNRGDFVGGDYWREFDPNDQALKCTWRWRRKNIPQSCITHTHTYTHTHTQANYIVGASKQMIALPSTWTRSEKVYPTCMMSVLWRHNDVNSFVVVVVVFTSVLFSRRSCQTFCHEHYKVVWQLHIVI